MVYSKNTMRTKQNGVLFRRPAAGRLRGNGKRIKIQREIDLVVKDKYGGSIPKREGKAASFMKDIERLKRGEPLDYVIGWIEFLGCKIDLSEKPLIPREETEFWVAEAIQKVNSLQLTAYSKKKIKILDIFAGSGCIGIAVLKHVPDVKVIFSDSEGNCLKQIRKNLKINKLKGKVVQSDIFFNISGKFDLIFCNPPYIPVASVIPAQAGIQTKKGLGVQKSVLDWEPDSALWGGADGLSLIKRFLKEARNYLKPEGKIFMEFGFGQKAAIEKLLTKYRYAGWRFHKDQFNRWRWVEIASGNQ